MYLLYFCSNVHKFKIIISKNIFFPRQKETQATSGDDRDILQIGNN